MKTVFISKYYNHHQQPLSDALYRLSCEKFHFISTGKDPARCFGFANTDATSYVVYSATESSEKIEFLIDESDVTIIGGDDYDLIKKRIKGKKLIFKYTERPLKKGFGLLKYPYRFLKWHFQNPSDAPIYLLCASAYASSDYSKFLLYKNRMYKWGYFPEAKQHDTESLFKKKNKTEILWCGRFLDWKHPDDAVFIAHRLRSAGYDFVLNFIGSGFMERTMRQMIAEYHLEDMVHILEPIPQGKVREHMEQAGIYLFTSDRQEGWGAVLNESMNSGCAVVASSATGATPYLLKTGENGFIYESGNTDELYKNVEFLLKNPDEQRRLGEAAYRTITEEWNAEVAAERFVNLCQHIKDGEKYPDLFESGPCSKA